MQKCTPQGSDTGSPYLGLGEFGSLELLDSGFAPLLGGRQLLLGSLHTRKADAIKSIGTPLQQITCSPATVYTTKTETHRTTLVQPEVQHKGYISKQGHDHNDADSIHVQ